MRKLALVFTLGMSVERWHKRGLLDREKLLYEEFLRQGAFEKIYWFTYGANDKKFSYLINENIEIIPMPWIFNTRLGMFIYSFLMPIVKAKYFKQTDIIKSNQMKGSWTAWIAALLYKKKFVLRMGYVWSRFVKKGIEADIAALKKRDWIEENIVKGADGVWKIKGKKGAR